MWADYIKEQYGKHTLVREHGFATYFIVPGTSVVYIEDIYVAPEARKTGLSTEMEQEIIAWAKSEGCTEVMGSTNLTSPTPEHTLAVAFKKGYKISSVTSDMIYVKKQIN